MNTVQKARQKNKNYNILFGIIFIILVALSAIFPPEGFADYFTYVSLTDSMYNGYARSWYSFEPLSSGGLVLLRHVLSNAFLAVDFYHYVVTGFFFVFFFIDVRAYRASWYAILIVFAAYGPLLAFVTLRATPAYLLIALAAIKARDGKYSCITLCVIAALFHISALFAAPPVLLCFVQNKFNLFGRINRVGGGVVISGLLYGGLFFIFHDYILSFLSGIISRFSVIGKYSAYLAASDQTSTSVVTTPSIFHIIYLFLASAFVVFFTMQKDKNCKDFRGYIYLSYGIFLFMQISPVSAFRQSLFWMIPGILLIPWQQFKLKSLMGPAIIVFSIIVFVVGFRGVLSAYA